MAMARLRACTAVSRALRGGRNREMQPAFGHRSCRRWSSKVEDAPNVEDDPPNVEDEPVMEGEPEPEEHTSTINRVFGTFVKIAVGVPLLFGTMNVLTSMGDTWVKPAIKQVRSKDPFMQRSGAYRLNMMAYNDKRRTFVVEAGAVPWLVQMLETAPDDKTRKSALEVLANLAQCDAGLEAVLAVPGGEGVVQAVAESSDDAEIQVHAKALMDRLDRSSLAVA